MVINNEDDTVTASKKSKTAIVIGLSSDIGNALCTNWIRLGWDVYGTYRTLTPAVIDLKKAAKKIVHCDLGSVDSIEKAVYELGDVVEDWDVLVFGPGLQEPVGVFSKVDIQEWVYSFEVNFTNQIRLLHSLLPAKKNLRKTPPTVIFFAGGGVNDAPTGYSAYTVAKIAMIKMVEILAAEIKDIFFTILGPGWVKTKIHNSILELKDLSDPNYLKVKKRFDDDKFISMELVVQCCNSIIESADSTYTGRNISVEFDSWGSDALKVALLENPDMYKLRRSGNSFKVDK